MKIEISKLHLMAQSMSFSDFNDWLKHKLTKTPETVVVHGEVIADLKICYGDIRENGESFCWACKCKLPNNHHSELCDDCQLRG